MSSNQSRHARSFRRTAGFSLIEILVAVLIVSVGVLGVAGLQLISLQNNTSALLRTQAFQSAYEIIDRARANRGESYAIAMADAPPGGADCLAANCATADMRDFDLDTWLADLAATLPNGDGSIVVAGGDTTVTVQWLDDRGAAPATFDVEVTTTL